MFFSVLIVDTFFKYEPWKENRKNSFELLEHIKILDALSATGLRSIRYALELKSNLSLKIIANDVSPKAVETIKRNVEHHNLGHLIKPNCQDAA